MKITGTTKNKREVDRYLTAMQKAEPVIINHTPYAVISVDYKVHNRQYSYTILLQEVNN